MPNKCQSGAGHEDNGPHKPREPDHHHQQHSSDNTIALNRKVPLVQSERARSHWGSLSSWHLPILICQVFHFHLITQAQQPSTNSAFPGVSRDLASFCSARPSLSIELAPMLVHVKRNTSFNYKLYLFSNDEHVFQTGQIVPRDDFRIHSFPVKLKHLNEFVPIDGSEQDATRRPLVEVYQLVRSGSQQSPTRQKLVRVQSSSFSPRRFFSQVPLNPDETPARRAGKRSRSASSSTTTTTTTTTTSRPANRVPLDVQGDALPGDAPYSFHDVASSPDSGVSSAPELQKPSPLSSPPPNVNEHIEFDRDDQLAILSQPANKLRELNRRHSATTSGEQGQQKQDQSASQRPHSHHQTMVMPVGSFSSFRVNYTYLARKDFGQLEPELVRLRVDPHRFQVSRVDLLEPLQQQPMAAINQNGSLLADDMNGHNDNENDRPEAEDYAFLSHKLLRDPNTRLTSISQIYEDWITRNFYTIVYIQRRLNGPTEEERDDVTVAADEFDDKQTSTTTSTGQSGRRRPQSPSSHHELVTDRLVFRGSSIVLLGADQLNYHVKASAFITEKNGLHYYLEFLPNGKFHLGAIDWTKRPFKFIDSQRFPIKPTQTQFDNEELLLCPPSVCYSEQPIDELVGYGRLALADKLQREASILSKSSSSSSGLPPAMATAEFRDGARMVALLPEQTHTANSSMDNSTTTVSHQSESISLDNLIEAMRLGSSRLDVRLHLRDWVWQLPRISEKRTGHTKPTRLDSNNTNNDTTGSTSKFAWHYEWARRNEIKVAPDTYGFALVGHEIDASYRVFNELYLISANQLISINYTLANETVTSVQPIEEEFAGLSSSLLDPITGAFYDRYSNQIYFFKGDRYVGYDYATKKPLEDFLLPPAIDDSLGGLGLALMMRQQQQQAGGLLTATTTKTTTTSHRLAEAKQAEGAPLVSSLPVVGILGWQHHVDAIYHDLHEDLVYVFSGMKFYTRQASDFKDGAFRGVSASRSEHQMQCINEHFLTGCRFDAAYPNPCKSDDHHEGQHHHQPQPTSGSGANDGDEHDNNGAVREAGPNHLAKLVETEHDAATKTSTANKPDRSNNFSEEQQMKLRAIAARGGLMDFLLENTLVAQGAARAFEPLLGAGVTRGGAASRSSEQEQIVIYLLIAMVLITVLVTVAMIVVVLNWTRFKSDTDHRHHHHGPQALRGKSIEEQRVGGNPLAHGQLLTERVAYPAAISQYLSNQYQQHQQQQQNRQRPASYYYGPQPFSGRRPSGHGRSPAPLTSPPPLPPPPEPRHQYRAQVLSESGRATGGNSRAPDQHSSLVDSSVF